MQNIRLTIIIVSFICTVTSFSGSSNIIKYNNDPILYVSIIDLIIRPHKLPEGRNRISVIGFLDQGGTELYLTKEYAKLGDIAVIPVATPNSGLLPETCTNRYVRLTGIWRREPRGREGFSVIQKVEIINNDYLENESSKSFLILPAVCWEAEK